MAKKKYVKRISRTLYPYDLTGKIEDIVAGFVALSYDFPNGYIEEDYGYDDYISFVIHAEIPMTEEEIAIEKAEEKRLRDEKKAIKAKDAEARKEKLQELYKEFFGQELEI